ncbi:MAG: A/G-specific adenine glycosylase [Bacteroidetes bacterium]|nr:A/G-specific adenine glycosylase [Bacteroidota bacterium]
MTEFLNKLLSWYQANARDFPFRRTTDPYLIWLSEVIMQQTRIEQGVPYYYSFVKVFPTIHELAGASEEEVLKQWQGLGYYTRARNLHSTANEIVEKYGGRFPESYESLRELKGIGDYTAAAIASICYRLPHPVMDGNVIRFITRHFGITGAVDLAATKKEIMEVLEELMDGVQRFPKGYNASGTAAGSPLGEASIGAKHFTQAASGSAKRDRSGGVKMRANVGDRSSLAEEPSHNSLYPGKFNQAMIEFGATYCVPRNPECRECIFNESCIALKYGMVEKLPLKKQQQALKPRYFHYLVISVWGMKGVYFRKRTGNDIWKGLYEFPLIETSKPVTLPRLVNSIEWKKYFGKTPLKILSQTGSISHLLSHQKIIATFYSLEIEKPSEKFGSLIHPKNIHELPVARIIEKYLEGVRGDK